MIPALVDNKVLFTERSIIKFYTLLLPFFIPYSMRTFIDLLFILSVEASSTMGIT